MGFDLFCGKEPYRTQRKFLGSQARFVCYGGLVGPGKTTALCWKIFWLCVNFARNLGYLGRWVEDHLWDTTFENWKECFPLEQFGHIMRYDGGDREPRGIEIAARDPNNPEVLSWDYKSTVRLVPLSNPKRFPGGQLGFFGIDQAEQIPDVGIFTALMRRLRRKSVPWPDQHGLLTANYEGNFDWIQELFIDHRVENRPLPPDEAAKYEFIEAAPEETDANFGEGYRKEQLAVLPPLQAKTLILGINVRTVGRVYKMYDEAMHVRAFECAEVSQDRGGLSWIVGYDYGMDPDPTVILLVGVDSAGRLWIRAEHVMTNMTIKDSASGPGHETSVRDLAAKVGFPLEAATFVAGVDIFGKKHTGLRISDEWSNDFDWTGANTDIAAGIERVATLLSTRPKKPDNPEEDDLPLLVVHPDCETTRYALQYYKYAEDGSGRPAKKQAPGIRDCADVARYIALAAQNPRPPRPAKSSILTPDSYRKIVRANKRGLRVGFWVPVVGGVDPAKEGGKRSPFPHRPC